MYIKSILPIVELFNTYFTVGHVCNTYHSNFTGHLLAIKYFFIFIYKMTHGHDEPRFHNLRYSTATLLGRLHFFDTFAYPFKYRWPKLSVRQSTLNKGGVLGSYPFLSIEDKFYVKGTVSRKLTPMLRYINR